MIVSVDDKCTRGRVIKVGNAVAAKLVEEGKAEVVRNEEPQAENEAKPKIRKSKRVKTTKKSVDNGTS